MKAILFDAGRPIYSDAVDQPVPADGELLIRVAYAGICRTDVYAAQGRIPVAQGRTLGHEFSGYVAVTDGADLRVGERVAVTPYQRRGEGASMLGLDRDGAFTQYITVPQSSVFRVPDGVSLRSAAFAEPVAAALAVPALPLPRDGRGLLYGRGRHVTLTERALRFRGFSNLHIASESSPEHSGRFDFAVDCTPDASHLDALIKTLKLGGTLVLKSRTVEPTRLDVGAAVSREIMIRTAHYAPFAEALDALANGLQVEDLFGPEFPLSAYDAAFREATTESKKCFFLNEAPT